MSLFMMLVMVMVVVVVVATPKSSGPTLELECALRSVAFDLAQRHPTSARHAAEIHTSLQLQECNRTASPRSDFTEPSPCPDGRHWSICPDHKDGKAFKKIQEGSTWWVDCSKGKDTNIGSKKRPFATIERGQAEARLSGPGSHIFLRGGTCYLKDTLHISPEDSGMSMSTYANEDVTLSGGLPLRGLDWTPWKKPGKIMVATLPEGVNASKVDSLFMTVIKDSRGMTSLRRMVRARFPNGDSEEDRLPEGYDKLAGEVSSVSSWLAAGNHSLRYPEIVRNNSFYPWFGHSNDIRWVMDYHLENESSYFRPPQSFWQSQIGTATRYNQTTFSKRVSNWTNVNDALIHVIHYDWWGNWQWRRLMNINNTLTLTLTLTLIEGLMKSTPRHRPLASVKGATKMHMAALSTIITFLLRIYLRSS